MALAKPVDQIVEETTNPLLEKHESWERVLIGDIAEIDNGFAFKSKSFNKEGNGMPLIRIRDVAKGKTETYYEGEYDEPYIVNPGDLLIGMDGDFNSARWTGRPALLNQRVCRIRLVSDVYDEGFLTYALQPYLDEINKETSSVTVKHLSSKTVSQIPLPLPPLPEQRRIVARIKELSSRLDAGVAALRHAKGQLQRYRQSVLAAAVTGQLTQAWREQHPDTEPASELLVRILEERQHTWRGRGKYKEPQPADELELDLPSTWTTTNIDSVISGIEAGKNFKCEERPPTDGETGLVKISAVTWGKFDELESKTVTQDDQIREEHIIHPGDFLLSRANTLELVGAPVIVEQVTRRLMLSDKVLRFRFIEGLEKFALFWLRSKLGRKEIESRATGNQLSMRNIAQGSLRAIPIPLPPLAEQHQIVAEVEARTTAIDDLEAELDRQITRSNRLRQSTLAAAFSGKLFPQESAASAKTASSDDLFPELPSSKKKKVARRKSPRPASTTDLQAGLIALAIRAHEQSEEHLGHVKAEKMIHLCDALHDLELNRTPTKQAAGPNDTRTTKKVEKRAEMKGWFTIIPPRREQAAYRYEPGRNFDSLIQGIQQKLGSKSKHVEDLISSLSRFTMRQTELLATVYAAWNNLLLRREEITEETIVTEARENWHPEKLKIDRDYFFKALDYLKEHNLTPSGKGQIVS